MCQGALFRLCLHNVPLGDLSLCWNPEVRACTQYNSYSRLFAIQHTSYFKMLHGAREMAHSLGATYFSSENLCLLPSSHMAAYRHLKLPFQTIWHLLLVCSILTNTQKHLRTHKIIHTHKIILKITSWVRLETHLSG